MSKVPNERPPRDETSVGEYSQTSPLLSTTYKEWSSSAMRTPAMRPATDGVRWSRACVVRSYIAIAPLAAATYATLPETRTGCDSRLGEEHVRGAGGREMLSAESTAVT